MPLGPLDGAIVTIKDSFDVAGEVTRAGSKVLAEEGLRATADAPVVRRLREAGAIVVAKTNMTEFAYNGIGINPHFGTPRNPADRARVPGGSSSGGAVAVVDGFCEIAIGSDTGGSTRIPAALCGIVGFKPSRQRIPTEGLFPLSYTLDSIGPMAGSVGDCARADAVMADETQISVAPAPVSGLRLGILEGFPVQDLDATVGSRFSWAIDCLSKAGARITHEAISLIDAMSHVNRRGGITPPEAFAILRNRLASTGDKVDQDARRRIERRGQILAADYIQMLRERSALVKAMDQQLVDLDALVMPTVPIVAPRLEEVETRDGFSSRNAALMRTTIIATFFDMCAISLPLPRDDGLPVGLMLASRNGQDRRLLRIAVAIERLFAA
jgi:aspartyl-tRNA(Asn)/glutamyl-tRNA(Gln) amidotransferase subunit A